MNGVPDWLQMKNSRSVAVWRWRWHLQGGSKHWAARDLQDLRNENDMRRYRAVQFGVWQALRRVLRAPKKANVAQLRIKRAKRIGR